MTTRKGDEARAYFARVRALMFAQSGNNQGYAAAVMVFDMVALAMEAEADREEPTQEIVLPPEPAIPQVQPIGAASGTLLGGGTGGAAKTLDAGQTGQDATDAVGKAPQPRQDGQDASNGGNTASGRTGAVAGPLS